MKRISIILIFFSLQYLPVALSAAEKSLSPSQCGCELKEALKKGNWQKARESAENLIEKSPNAPEAGDAYLWLGLYHKSKHDFSKSTKFYQKAAELFPDTWASAEASARIGCNYYKLNNYSKSLEYFRNAGSEAKTWQQKKYASTWAKWVRSALAGGEKRLVSNCATKSINYYLSSKGIKYDKQKLASSLTLKDGLVPLSQILKFLKKEDIKLKAIKCPLDEIEDLQLPIVAVIKPSHLIVIKDIVKDIDKKIIVYDPVLGEITYYEKELAEIWADKVLTLSTLSDKKFAKLAKKELNKIFIGTCYCCPNFPPTPCEKDSDDCSCNRAESGGGGSGSGDGGCPGCPMGFPRITVDTSSLALIVRDTPIGYITALGEDVKVSLTFNSDLSHSGVFGNSWHSNLETKIVENSGDSVIVTRSGGHDDTFTDSGGQYNPPVGVSNKLVKNPDGTFLLEFTKSHRKYHYDTHLNGGKLLAMEDRNGNTVSYQYDTNNNITSITDAVGRITDIETDTAEPPRITRVIDPLGREATFTYDSSGNLTRVVDMAGNIFIYTYDSINNITSITEPKGDYVIQYAYETELWVTSITDPEDNLYQYEGYLAWPNTVIDPRGNHTDYYADSIGHVEDPPWPFYGDTVIIADDLGNYISYTYDDNRNKTEIRDKRGNITHFDYDTNHNLTSKTDPEQNHWSYTYDTYNRLLSAVDPRGKSTIYEYDSYTMYNLLSVTEKAPDQTILSVISYTYDGRGLTASMTANGKLTDYDYDPNGNLIQITDPEENITTFGYDCIGRKTSMTNANGTTTYEYDNLDRITKITHPDSNYIQNTYNCCGLSQRRDENGKITAYEYDSLGRLTKVTDAKGKDTIYTYDEVGNLVSLKDAMNRTTIYTYNDLNQLTTITYPLGDYETYTYDEEGNMLTKKDGNGRFTYYTYDDNNRLIEIKLEN